jgi:phosphate-selective porin OprO and OprP
MGGNYFSGDWIRESKPKLSFAGVYSFSDNATRTGVQLGEALYQNRDVTTIIADMLFKYKGWSIMAEYFNRHTDNPVTFSGTLKPRYVYNGEGMNFHLSYQFKNHFEIAGRYCNVNPMNPVNTYEVNQTDYVLGFNKYLKFHRTKLQTDVTYFTKLNEVTDVSTAGWMIRFQVELGI